MGEGSVERFTNLLNRGLVPVVQIGHDRNHRGKDMRTVGDQGLDGPVTTCRVTEDEVGQGGTSPPSANQNQEIPK